MNPHPLKGGKLSSRDKFPCNKFPDGICPKRKPGCQDKCPDFLAAKAANDARKAVERAKRYANNDVNKFKIDSAVKGSRKKIAER
jgi:hypothetical protein